MSASGLSGMGEPPRTGNRARENGAKDVDRASAPNARRERDRDEADYDAGRVLRRRKNLTSTSQGSGSGYACLPCPATAKITGHAGAF